MKFILTWEEVIMNQEVFEELGEGIHNKGA